MRMLYLFLFCHRYIFSSLQLLLKQIYPKQVLSNMECKKYSLLTGENKWFIEKPINTSNLTDIIVEQAKDTIEGMSYA